MRTEADVLVYGVHCCACGDTRHLPTGVLEPWVQAHHMPTVDKVLVEWPPGFYCWLNVANPQRSG